MKTRKKDLKTECFQLRTTPKMKKQLEALADAEMTTVSAILLRALLRHLDTQYPNSSSEVDAVRAEAPKRSASKGRRRKAE